MDAMAPQITGILIVYTTVWSGEDKKKHQSFASLAWVTGIHRWPVNSPQNGPVTRKKFSFDDVIVIRIMRMYILRSKCRNGIVSEKYVNCNSKLSTLHHWPQNMEGAIYNETIIFVEDQMLNEFHCFLMDISNQYNINALAPERCSSNLTRVLFQTDVDK